MNFKQSMKALAQDLKWILLAFAIAFFGTGMSIALDSADGDLTRICMLLAIGSTIISLVCSKLGE